MPTIVLRTWNDVTQNYKPYKNLFSDNFVSVANTLEDEKINNLEDIIDKYLTPYKPRNTKPKTAARQKYADKQKAKTTSEIKALLGSGANDIIDSSVSAEEAKSKIKSFLN